MHGTVDWKFATASFRTALRKNFFYHFYNQKLLVVNVGSILNAGIASYILKVTLLVGEKLCRVI